MVALQVQRLMFVESRRQQPSRLDLDAKGFRGSQRLETGVALPRHLALARHLLLAPCRPLASCRLLLASWRVLVARCVPTFGDFSWPLIHKAALRFTRPLRAGVTALLKAFASMRGGIGIELAPLSLENGVAQKLLTRR